VWTALAKDGSNKLQSQKIPQEVKDRFQ